MLGERRRRRVQEKVKGRQRITEKTNFSSVAKSVGF